MADTTLEAVMTLARQDVFQLRLSGLILGALVERQVISGGEARSLVEDVLAKVPAEMDAWRQALEALRAEFPG